MVQNSILVKGPTIGKMNLKSSANKSGFLDPNSASGDKSCFVRTISFSGSKGNLEFFKVSLSSKSPLSELTFGLKVILCHSDSYTVVLLWSNVAKTSCTYFTTLETYRVNFPDL